MCAGHAWTDLNGTEFRWTREDERVTTVEGYLRLLRLPRVLDKTGLSRSSLYEKIASGDFPKPVRLGTDAKSVGWPEHEVDGWIQNAIRRRDGDEA